MLKWGTQPGKRVRPAVTPQNDGADPTQQASNGPRVVDAEFAAVLEEHFGIPAAPEGTAD